MAPLVQRRTVEMPPVLTIFSQTVFGTLFGPLGLILATPIAAALMVAVRIVYIEGVLGDRPEPVAGRNRGRYSGGCSKLAGPTSRFTSRNVCGCTTRIGAIPTRRRCCSCMAGATIAGAGTGWRRGFAAVST